MAGKKKNEIAVGMTVLVVLALTIYIVVMLADWASWFAEKQTIRVTLPYEEGLKGLMVGSPIYLGGVKVGLITEAGIVDWSRAEEDVEEVQVYFVMEMPVQYKLRRDCVLLPQSNVLGGQASLQIKNMGKDGEMIVSGQTLELKELEGGIADTIATIKDQFDVDNPESIIKHLKDIFVKIDEQVTVDQEKQSLFSKLHVIMDRLGKISAQVHAQLEEENNQATIVKLNKALDSLNRSLVQVENLVQKNDPVLTGFLVSMKNTAAQLEKDLPGIIKQVKEALAKAQTSMETAQEGLENLKEAAVGVKDVVQVNREQIDRVVGNIGETSANLKMVSRQIRRAPWKLIYKPKKDELKIQGLIDSAGAFAAGAEQLDSAAIRLKSLLSSVRQSEGVESSRLQKIIAELENSFERFDKAEERFWDELGREK